MLVFMSNERDCKDSKIYYAAGHVVNGNFKAISNSILLDYVVLFLSILDTDCLPV